MIQRIVLYVALSICCSATTTLSAAASPQTVCQQILDRLFATNGNYKFSKPTLVLTAENRKVAAYMPARRTIYLDEKTYAICRELGRDSQSALAFIIGHELAHAYQSEVKGRRAQTNFLAYDRNYTADLRLEKVADIQGLLGAYLAGYGVLRSMPAVLEKIYEAYDLKGKNLPGYPTLAERQATTTEVLRIAEQLADLLEASNYLMAIGRQSVARTGYEYILQYYQGREIYNNLGIAYALSAQDFWDPQTDIYVYPLEADWHGKLDRANASRGQGGIDPDLQPLRLAFLQKAETAFRDAAALDPNYLPARTSVICVLNMMQRPADALHYYDTQVKKLMGGKKKVHNQDSELAELATGIAHALLPGVFHQTEAEAIFRRLENSQYVASALYGRQNRQVLLDEISDDLSPEFKLPDNFRQLVSQMQLGRTDGMERTKIDAGAGIYFLRERKSDSSTFVFANEQGNLVSLLRFQNRLAAGVTILDPQEDLGSSAYRNIIVARDGFYLKSPRDKIVLKLDAKGHVLEMLRYIEHGKG